jgi:phosphomethylpyrimidine synthase
MTLLEKAKKGILTEEIKKAAAYENVPPEDLMKDISLGYTVIPKNIDHSFNNVRAIGKNLLTKINANIGTSSECTDVNKELEKLKVAIEAGADSVMDLSTGGNLLHIREKILEKSNIMVGAVPIYSLATDLVNNNLDATAFDIDKLLKVIEKECSKGIDYITVHCGITFDAIKNFDPANRLCGVVSRGGSILIRWMLKNKKENPLFEYFDELLKIAYKYDVTLSLGDALRPGSIFDAGDYLQYNELLNLSLLAKKAHDKNVQVMIEGPGHVPINEITEQVKLEKKLCNGRPFYVLGPLPTDIALGFDHIAAAVGASIAAAHGADFLCYVTPAEHIGLPDVSDVYEGVVASKIAAHIGDLAKGNIKAIDKDMLMSKHRANLEWNKMFELAIDKKRAAEKFKENPLSTCSMCGKLCAIKLSKD